MRLIYPIELEPDDGGFLVRFPDWGMTTWGEDKADALAQADDCLEAALEHCLAKRLPIPYPSPLDGRRGVEPGSQFAMTAALWMAMREQDVSISELARRLGQLTPLQVRRLLNPRQASHPDRIDAAMAALHRRLTHDLVAA